METVLRRFTRALATEIRDGLIACCVAFRTSRRKAEPETSEGDRFVDELVSEIAPLWSDLPSNWNDPGIDDIQAFSERLAERLAIPGDHELFDVQRLLHAALAFARIVDRLDAESVPRGLTLIPGEGRHPAGPAPQLRLLSRG